MGIPWSGNVVSPWGRSGGTTPFDQLLERDESIPEGFFALNIMIDQQTLKDLFEYDPDTGIFTRKKAVSNQKQGCIAGCQDGSGYSVIRVKRISYRAHRLAWMYVYGKFPENEIDHINRIRSDNRICNLREVSRNQNMQNKDKAVSNKTGYKGVSISKQKKYKKFVAQIKFNGKVIYLGRYFCAESAYAAYCKAANELHTHNEVIKSQ